MSQPTGGIGSLRHGPTDARMCGVGTDGTKCPHPTNPFYSLT